MAEKKKTRKYTMKTPRYKGGSRPRKKLTLKQVRAIDAYFANGGDKKAALIEAGYSQATAEHAAWDMFAKPLMQQEMERRQKKLAKKHSLNADWVVKRMMRLATAGEELAHFKRVDSEGNIFWDFTGATTEELGLISKLQTDVHVTDDDTVVKKIKVEYPDAMQALNALARHLGLFNDSLEIKGSLADRIQAGKARLRAQRNEDADPNTIH